VCGQARAADEGPRPLPLAGHLPAFSAPEEPPPDDAVADPPVVEEAGPLALENALALALMNSPELEVYSWEVRVGEARALQAGKTANPELDIRLWRLENGPDDDRQRVILSQLIELGGKPRRRFDLAHSERELAGWNYEAKRIEVATRVASRFVVLLGAQRRRASLQEAVSYFDELERGLAQLVESGAMRSVSLHEVKRWAGLTRIDLHEAESELEIARYRLAATWGSRDPRFTEAVGELEETTPIPDIETVLAMAQGSPAIARWDAELARGQAALRLARARRVPDVRYGLGTRWEDDFDQRDYLLDFEVSLPIFDRKQGEIKEARYEMARARAGKQAAEAASGAGIAELYFALTESEARRKTLGDEVVPAARALFEAYRIGFDRQAERLGDLFDARRDLARAEVQYTEALVDYHRALTRLEGAVGQSLALGE
jgi:cobalt-zinc-cadmium efflux system outer membrane protein